MIFLYSSQLVDSPLLESPRSHITYMVAGGICLPFVLLSQLIKGKDWCYTHKKALTRASYLLCLVAVFGALYFCFPDRAFTLPWILITVLECGCGAMMVSTMSRHGLTGDPEMTVIFFMSIFGYLYGFWYLFGGD